MKQKLKRYDFNGQYMEMREYDDGNYVKFSDIEPLIKALQFFASENLYSMDSFVTSAAIYEMGNPTNIMVNENPILHLGLDKARQALKSIGEV